MVWVSHAGYNTWQSGEDDCMDRKAVARETLEIMHKGYYECEGTRIEIKASMEQSVRDSLLITPEQGARLLEREARQSGQESQEMTQEAQLPAQQFQAGEQHGSGKSPVKSGHTCPVTVADISTVDAIRRLYQEGKREIGVLNFASAKNPGGGFLNGAMAQEESLAASGTLYKTLTAHEEYYRANRAQRSMIYTDHAIYSPQVLFFRDGQFRLTKDPVEASVLTLPAVNMGQVIQKGEDRQQAHQAMRRRMELALAIFASQGARHLVLGAYGCGVFRNDPAQVALWWKELLEEGWGRRFDSVFHAVLDRSRSGDCIRAFQQVEG